MKRAIFPVGAAVHTRDINRGKDYGWYVRQKNIWLFSEIENIYRIALRDTGGDTRKLALLISEKRAGLLICDIPSERIDHGNRIINDTLYVEFESPKRPNILKYAADLLTCCDKDYEVIKEKAVKYAEQLYHNHEMKNEKFSIYVLNISEKSEKFSGKHAFNYSGNNNFSDDDNVIKCSAYLKWLSKDYTNNSNDKTFAFVSTGRAGVERCRQIADKYDRCLILTMTSEIDAELNLQKKTLFSIIKKKYYFKDIYKRIIDILHLSVYIFAT